MLNTFEKLLRHIRESSNLSYTYDNGLFLLYRQEVIVLAVISSRRGEAEQAEQICIKYNVPTKEERDIT